MVGCDIGDDSKVVNVTSTAIEEMDRIPVDQLTPRPGRPNLGASPSFHYVKPSPELVHQHEVPATSHEDMIPRSLTVRNGNSSDPSSPSPVVPSIRQHLISSSAPPYVTAPGSYTWSHLVVCFNVQRRDEAF